MSRNLTLIMWCSMTMAALRWSSLVECMHGTVLTLDEQRVRLYCCVCAWIWRCYYWCSINAVWGRNLMLSKYTTIMVMTALRWSSILECIMGPVSCWPWTNSAYVYIAWIWHVLLQYDVVIILSSSYAVQIHYNGDDGSAFIVVGWMYVMGVVLTLDK